jgi:hypothetical protein
VTQAAWVLLAAFVLSLVYEVYRATAKAGTSRHDSMHAFAKNNIGFYAIAAIVIALLFAGLDWGPWVASSSREGRSSPPSCTTTQRSCSSALPALSTGWKTSSSPGLLFVAAGLLIYQVLGITLQP